MRRTFLSAQMGCFQFFFLFAIPTRCVLFGGLGCTLLKSEFEWCKKKSRTKMRVAIQWWIPRLHVCLVSLFTVSGWWHGGLVNMNGKYNLVQNRWSFSSHRAEMRGKVFIEKQTRNKRWKFCLMVLPIWLNHKLKYGELKVKQPKLWKWGS